MITQLIFFAMQEATVWPLIAQIGPSVAAFVGAAISSMLFGRAKQLQQERRIEKVESAAKVASDANKYTDKRVSDLHEIRARDVDTITVQMWNLSERIRDTELKVNQIDSHISNFQREVMQNNLETQKFNHAISKQMDEIVGLLKKKDTPA